MLYCPKCKNEYQDGYQVCSDCHCDLVTFEELYPKKPIYFGSEKEMQVIADFLSANHIKDVEVKASSEDETFEVYVEEKDNKAAKKLLDVYLSAKNRAQILEALAENEEVENPDSAEAVEEELDELLEEDTEDELTQKMSDMKTMAKMYEPAKTHENSREKGEEYRSTGNMLIGFGIVGLILDVLMYLDKFPIHFSGSSKYLSCGLMGALFLMFLVSGISSLKSSKVLVEKGKEEEDLKERIVNYVKENLTKELIDQELNQAVSDDSVMYFARSEKLKQKITSEFEAEDSLIEEIIDELYEQIFG